MIRHLVVFSLRDDLDEADRKALLDELNTFPTIFPAMRRFALGRNVSRRDDTYAYAFTVEFASEDDLTTYLDSDEHMEFVHERFQPGVANRAIVSFEVPDGAGTGAAGGG